MRGLAGADVFAFSQRNISAKITDYHDGEDKLEFDHLGPLSLRDLHVSYDHGNTILDIAGDHITLVGVTPRMLDVHDFVFG